MTTKQRISEYLLAGNKLTRDGARDMFSTNSFLDIIFQLKKEYTIADCWCVNDKNGKRFKRWWMVDRKY